jgi:hypothetical protein
VAATTLKGPGRAFIKTSTEKASIMNELISMRVYVAKSVQEKKCEKKNVRALQGMSLQSVS